MRRQLQLVAAQGVGLARLFLDWTPQLDQLMSVGTLKLKLLSHPTFKKIKLTEQEVDLLVKAARSDQLRNTPQHAARRQGWKHHMSSSEWID